MKKLLLIFVIFTSTTYGQGVYPGIPLFGTASNQDRTYRDLQLGTTTITDSLGSTVDTLTLIPGFVSGAGAVFHKEYVLNLKDSCALAIRDVSSSFTYSTMTITINAPTLSGGGGAVYFTGTSLAPTTIKSSQWFLPAAATHVYPTSAHSYIMNLECFGNGWYVTSVSQD